MLHCRHPLTQSTLVCQAPTTPPSIIHSPARRPLAVRAGSGAPGPAAGARILRLTGSYCPSGKPPSLRAGGAGSPPVSRTIYDALLLHRPSASEQPPPLNELGGTTFTRQVTSPVTTTLCVSGFTTQCRPTRVEVGAARSVLVAVWWLLEISVERPNKDARTNTLSDPCHLIPGVTWKKRSTATSKFKRQHAPFSSVSFFPLKQNVKISLNHEI